MDIIVEVNIDVNKARENDYQINKNKRILNE